MSILSRIKKLNPVAVVQGEVTKTTQAAVEAAVLQAIGTIDKIMPEVGDLLTGEEVSIHVEPITITVALKPIKLRMKQKGEV
jgi:hypothetical protein